MIYHISQTENKEVDTSWFFRTNKQQRKFTSPFNVIVIGYFDILLLFSFWYFDIFFNNCARFSQKCFLNSNFHVAHMRSFYHTFSVSKPKKGLSDKIFIETQLAIKTNQLTDSSQFVFCLYCLYIFLSC